jgi:hypothetical protein
VQVARAGVEDTQVFTVGRVYGKLIKELAGVDHRGVPTGVELFEDVQRAVQVHRVVSNVGILAPCFAIGNDSPLPGLPRFWDTEQGGIGEGGLASRRGTYCPNFNQFIYKRGCYVQLFVVHIGVRVNNVGRFG